MDPDILVSYGSSLSSKQIRDEENLLLFVASLSVILSFFVILPLPTTRLTYCSGFWQDTVSHEHWTEALSSLPHGPSQCGI